MRQTVYNKHICMLDLSFYRLNKFFAASISLPTTSSAHTAVSCMYAHVFKYSIKREKIQFYRAKKKDVSR